MTNLTSTRLTTLLVLLCGCPEPAGRNTVPTADASVVLLPVPADPTPIFKSQASLRLPELGKRGTGFVFADLDGDGQKDAVVSHGNDIAQEDIVSYRNQRGTFAATPLWRSDKAHVQYHSKATAGDLDNDGCVDLVVGIGMTKDHKKAILKMTTVPESVDEPVGVLDETGAFKTGGVVIYLNQSSKGACQGLDTTPAFKIDMGQYVMAVDVGDIDADADLDIAVAPLAGKNLGKTPVHVLLNEKGRFSKKTWTGKPIFLAGDVDLTDANADGFLDLVIAGHPGIQIYRGKLQDGKVTLSDTPETHPSGYAGTEGPGWGVAVAHQEGATPCDYVASTYGCLLYDANSNSCPRHLFHGPVEFPLDRLDVTLGHNFDVAYRDLDGDAIPDVLRNLWKARKQPRFVLHRGESGCKISEHVREPIEDFPVPQQMDFADVWGRSTERTSIAIPIAIPINATRHVVTLPVGSSERILSVVRVRKGQPDRAMQSKRNGDTPADYIVGHRGEWISFSEDLLAGDVLKIEYEFTRAPDLGVASWDPAVPARIFCNLMAKKTPCPLSLSSNKVK